MAKKMLIDATHVEEQRVAIMDGTRLDDFEAEISTKKQLKGNIYLAKIIRIEPSLQAAFVEFGANRHGFLPFSEIHPDYYRLPVGDRSPADQRITHPDSVSFEEDPLQEPSLVKTPDPSFQTDLGVEEMMDPPDLQDEEETFIRHPKVYKYKIQEVIKRRQIVLIQVVKEERGNKGAALTTYLSLPGRYCVLMPNAGHRSGGISRKITDLKDRKRLREVLNDVPIPEGTSLIVRTAGQDRNKLEIRRDFEYLLRLWSEIRDTTLQSIAPKLIYAEGDLIKRTIRDNYGKDVDEILVEGEEGYKEAKMFMKTLIPSHAKKVRLYKDQVPLFRLYGVEAQIDAIMNPMATLPSGGSLVINPTEALVAVDVNSGKSIRERHIDETALKTNLEAADELARQMRLRDLGGLVVIDFIDMNDSKHIQAVEKRLKESCRHDRARIQIGRISQFGLLELSRQRLRPSIIETNMNPCPHCKGVGVVRSIESMALHVLRAIESSGIAGKDLEIVVTVPPEVDLYLLNQKRSMIISLEERYQFFVQIQRGKDMIIPDFHIESRRQRLDEPQRIEKVIELQSSMDKPFLIEELDLERQTDPVPLLQASEEVLLPKNQEKRRSRHGLFNSRRRGHHKKTQEEKEQVISPEDNHKVLSPEIGMTPSVEESVTDSEKQNKPEKRDHRRRQRRSQNHQHNKAIPIDLETADHQKVSNIQDPPSETDPFTGLSGPTTEKKTEMNPDKKQKRGWWKRLLES